MSKKIITVHREFLEENALSKVTDFIKKEVGIEYQNDFVTIIVEVIREKDE